LLQTPAAVRWIAAEPLLEKLDLKVGSWLKGEPAAKGPFLDWVVGGGEIGRNGQACHPDWVRSLRDQCAKGGTPFFWNQWGEHIPDVGVETSEAADKVTWQRLGSQPPRRLIDGLLHEAYP
jgi:protein gp37